MDDMFTVPPPYNLLPDLRKVYRGIKRSCSRMNSRPVKQEVRIYYAAVILYPLISNSIANKLHCLKCYMQNDCRKIKWSILLKLQIIISKWQKLNGASAIAEISLWSHGVKLKGDSTPTLLWMGWGGGGGGDSPISLIMIVVSYQEPPPPPPTMVTWIQYMGLGLWDGSDRGMEIWVGTGKGLE